MKFVCDNCGTQYLISDEKVGSKGAKIRCKRCGNIILLRPGESEPEPERQEEPSIPTDQNTAPDVEIPEENRDELGEAFDQLLKGGLDEGEDGDEGEHQATEIFNMEELQRLREGGGADEEQEKIDQVFSQAESTDVVRSGPAGGEDREEWYVAVGDEQVGPLVLAELERRWESGEVVPETLAWHPGMGDWTPVKDIPKLRYLLGAQAREPAPSEGPIPDQPGPAADEEDWAPAGGSSLSSLVEEEMQAVQSTAADGPPARQEDEDLGPVPGADEDEPEEGEIPPWEREDVVSGEVARPSESFFDSTLDQSSSSDSDDTGSSRSERELARPAYLTSQTKRKSPAKIIVITLVVLVVLGGTAVGVYFATQKTEGEQSGEMTPLDRPDSKDKKNTASGDESGSKKDHEDSVAEAGDKKDEKQRKDQKGKKDKKDKKDEGGKDESQKDVMVVNKASTRPEAVEKPAGDSSSSKRPGRDRPKTRRRRKKRVASAETRSKPVERKPPASTRADKPKEKPKEAGDSSKPKTSGGAPQTLPKSQIAATMKKYVRAMRGCVKQQQQRDPTVSGTMLVSFTIGNSGKVSTVRILSGEHKGTYVAGCITYIIKSIKFGKFTGDPITVPRVPLRLGG